MASTMRSRRGSRYGARLAIAGGALAVLHLTCTENDDNVSSKSGSSGSHAGGGSATGGTAGKPAEAGVPEGSCSGACFVQADGGCWCDPGCTARGDCCGDYDAACAANAVTLPSGCVLNPNFLALCNPVTNAGCDGGKCDLAPSGFACQSEQATLDAGAGCGKNGSNPVCIAGYVCAVTDPDAAIGTCRHLCCSAASCGDAGAKCVPIDAKFGSFGYCAGA